MPLHGIFQSHGLNNLTILSLTKHHLIPLTKSYSLRLPRKPAENLMNLLLNFEHFHLLMQHAWCSMHVGYIKLIVFSPLGHRRCRNVPCRGGQRGVCNFYEKHQCARTPETKRQNMHCNYCNLTHHFLTFSLHKFRIFSFMCQGYISDASAKVLRWRFLKPFCYFRFRGLFTSCECENKVLKGEHLTAITYVSIITDSENNSSPDETKQIPITLYIHTRVMAPG